MTTTRRPPSVVKSIRTSPERPRLLRCPTVAFANGLLDLDCRHTMSGCMFEVVVVPLDDLDLHGLPSPAATLLCVAILTDRNTQCAAASSTSEPTRRTKIK